MKMNNFGGRGRASPLSPPCIRQCNLTRFDSPYPLFRSPQHSINLETAVLKIEKVKGMRYVGVIEAAIVRDGETVT